MTSNVALIRTLGTGLASAVLVAAMLALVLLLKSVKDFSKTGPELREEIQAHFRLYAILATARLLAWTLAIGIALAAPGTLIYLCASILLDRHVAFTVAFLLSGASILVLAGFQFCRNLLYIPGSIAASYHYRKSRLYPLWQVLTPARLRLAGALLVALLASVVLATAAVLITRGAAGPAILLVVGVAAIAAMAYLSFRSPEPRPMTGNPPQRPNIVMIGSDTLRADRLGGAGYRRRLTPFIDELAARGTCFTACYVPCARTAPSLLSFLTGVWPHTHGIRDNFAGDAETHLDIDALPAILHRHGYRTAASSDWSGGDLGKFPLGFEILDIPDDQWNIKYLLRQGPKDLRLFLSLFTHNRFGKLVLPELYFLAGVPMTGLVGRDARRLISDFAVRGDSFFLNVFVSTTHPPFGSEHPYYTLWSDRAYAGESKFVMARLTDPWEIIRLQGDTKAEFEIDQVIDLYDGCVRNFDDEVRRIVQHLDACGLRENTIVVIYSDHGMEFFEHDTWGQGNSVRSEASARVPLVIMDPRKKGTGECTRIVRSVDLAPTLLELVGMEPHGSIDGVSLTPYLTEPGTDLGLAAFNETGIWLTDLPGMPPDHLRYPDLLELLEVPDKTTGTLAIKPEYRDVIIAAKDRMVRVGPWKLTFQPTTNGARYALFNVVDDPECRNDLSSAYSDVVRDLKARLHAWMKPRIASEPPSTGAETTIDQ